jgi:hydroxymethylbilane synthase
LLKSYLTQLEWAVLPLNINPNAAAQGALAVEILSTRNDLKDILAPIHDQITFECAIKERAMLASFGGGCHQKIGVSVLSRPYGEITLMRGLTDDGRVLETRRLDRRQVNPKFTAESMWSSDVKADREPYAIVSIDADLNAFYVARADAWPEFMDATGFIWAAGTKTWKNLAQKGIWVHGCSESMGEQEDPRIEVLAGQPLKWGKLSHDEGFEGQDEKFTLIPTYSLKNMEIPKELNGKECYFWNSGSQFLLAAQQESSLLKKHHACGPGNTSKVIRTYLEKNNSFDPNRLHIFLDQEDWRQQCKI